MARRNMLIERPAREVWEVLADGGALADRVIAADASGEEHGSWPQPGASISWTSRLEPPGPLARVLPAVSYGNRAVVRECVPPERLELEARAGGLGSARIALEVHAWGPDSTLLTLDEQPITGPGARRRNVLVGLAMRSRLRRMLTRLAARLRDEAARR